MAHPVVGKLLGTIASLSPLSPSAAGMRMKGIVSSQTFSDMSFRLRTTPSMGLGLGLRERQESKSSASRSTFGRRVARGVSLS